MNCSFFSAFGEINFERETFPAKLLFTNELGIKCITWGVTSSRMLDRKADGCFQWFLYLSFGVGEPNCSQGTIARGDIIHSQREIKATVHPENTPLPLNQSIKLRRRALVLLLCLIPCYHCKKSARESRNSQHLIEQRDNIHARAYNTCVNYDVRMAQFGSKNRKLVPYHRSARIPRLKVRIHRAILRAILCAMAKLHRVSTPTIVARNIAAVEFRPTSATLRATNFFVYPPSAAFRAIL